MKKYDELCGTKKEQDMVQHEKLLELSLGSNEASINDQDLLTWSKKRRKKETEGETTTAVLP